MAIKELWNGIWVIENDSHISKWVQECSNLAHDSQIELEHEYINPGATVIDCGANIGSHTIKYLEWVGDAGKVIAFEPCEESFLCLEHNCPKAENHKTALSNVKTIYKINKQENAGASYLSMPDIPPRVLNYLNEASNLVYAKPLDSYNFEPDYIKLDLEGFEVKALLGAKDTISEYGPTLMVEVNSGALERQGSSKGELFELLRSYDYTWKILQSNCAFQDPQYDVICIHNKRT